MAAKTPLTSIIPTSLKLASLKALAQKCGLQTTGTKSILLSRLHHEITSPSLLAAKKSTRILSIDMGIRNLAYCILDAPSTNIVTLKKVHGVVKYKTPTLQAWHRLAVSSKPEANPEADEEKTAVAKEAFDPATLSSIAYALLKTRLLLTNPDVILIERQRFRSMGSKHILEWTIRVNMFESILYATLHTLKAEGVWSGTVVPVAPGKVGPFWVGSEAEFLGEGELEKAKGARKKVRTSKSAKIKNKGAKIDLVRSWCGGEEGSVVGWGSAQVEDMVKRYMAKWDAKPGRTKGKKEVVEHEHVDVGEVEKMGKLDDLADCLLQGMAWVEWEKNKRLLLENGVEALLDTQ